MPRMFGICQLRRAWLSEVDALGILRTSFLLFGEAEASELEGVGEILGALHDASDGCARPLSGTDGCAVGEGEGLERGATRTHFMQIIGQKTMTDASWRSGKKGGRG